MRKCTVGIAGFGGVGRAVADLLLSRRERDDQQKPQSGHKAQTSGPSPDQRVPG